MPKAENVVGQGKVGSKECLCDAAVKFWGLTCSCSPAEDLADTIKVMKCAQGEEGISQKLCELIEQGELKLARRTGAGIITLCLALMRLHLEYLVQFRAPH